MKGSRISAGIGALFAVAMILQVHPSQACENLRMVHHARLMANQAEQAIVMYMAAIPHGGADKIRLRDPVDAQDLDLTLVRFRRRLRDTGRGYVMRGDFRTADGSHRYGIDFRLKRTDKTFTVEGISIHGKDGETRSFVLRNEVIALN